MSKRGIEALVATVLLVLITIAAVGIIWGAVMPMIKGNIEKSQRCYDVALEIKQGANTCYHVYEQTLDIQVSRGEKEVSIKDINIQIGSQGTSKSIKVSNETFVTQNNNTIPGPNEEVKYIIDVNKTGLPSVDYASVAAVLEIGKTESLCSASQPVSINEC
jgi:hypothetical protein